MASLEIALLAIIAEMMSCLEYSDRKHRRHERPEIYHSLQIGRDEMLSLISAIFTTAASPG